ncbi:MAG: hypothetical protein FD123_4325 [Bacteroidetes bacterium]|nr:MAG: hypothetical protein FD123_4325 [Bacteroidota bacterium]
MRTVFLLCFVFLYAAADARLPQRTPYSRMDKRVAFSTSGMGLMSFFKTDDRHSSPANPRTGFGLNARTEFIFTEEFRIFTGLEFLSQACTFNTYYFATGHSTYYDKVFDYTHGLRTYEVHLPVVFRLGLMRNESDLNNAVYMLGGWAMKYQLAARSRVEKITTGEEVWKGKATLDFENWFIRPSIGNVLVGGLGLDHRFNHSDESVFFEVIYRYGLSRYIYSGNVDTNDLVIKNASLSFAVGFRM